MKHQFLAQTRHTGYIPVTSPMAKFYIDKYNTKNRDINHPIVEKYSQSMILDQWTENNDFVVFDTDGIMANGQKRFLAVIKSGKTVMMDIKWGVPRAIAANIDRNQKRTLVHSLFFSGNTTAKTGAVGIALNFYRFENQWISRSVIPDAEIQDFLEEKVSAINAISTLTSRKSGFGKLGFLTALAVFAEKEEDKAVKFGKEVISGAKANGDGLRNDSASFRLRDYLLTDRNGGEAQLLENFEKTLYAVYMWNNNLTCRKLGRKTKLDL